MADGSRYDAVVIGAGPGGEVCAGVLADRGMKVAIVERELVGGECSFWGCIPSKTLLRPGEALEGAREAPGAREAVGGRGLDAGEAFKWRDFMVSDHTDDGQVPWLESKGIELLRGTGRVEAPGMVSVDGDRFRADRIVIATGSDPVIPPVEGLRELPGLWTNREVTAMTTVPQRLIVLGGGPIGVEMSQAVRSYGGRVVIVAGSADRLLPREAEPVGRTMREHFEREEGIEVRTGVRAEAVDGVDGEVRVRLDDGSELDGDRVLVCTGRRPRAAHLGLEKAGVELTDRGGVKVDDQLRAAEGVWAIGDATGLFLFTHVAKYQGRVAASAMCGAPARADYRAVPRVIFADPEVAAAGATEGERTGTVQLSQVARTATYTREYATRPGFLTLVAEGDHVTGAYAVGPQAGDWLQQATLAIRAQVPIDVLRDVIQPFPSFSEIVLAALEELGADDRMASDCWQAPVTA